MDLESISKIIKTKRKEKGLTQEELALKLNVTEKAVSRWETSRGTPDISLLIPLSNELGISVSEILNGKEDKQVNENIKEVINYIDVNKKTKSKMPLVISIIIYIVILFLYLCYLRFQYTTFDMPYYLDEIKNYVFFFMCTLIPYVIMTKYYCEKIEDIDKWKKITYIITLVLYISMIFNFAIIGRKFTNETRYNLIPFNTIIHYFTTKNNLSVFMINIIGNIVIYMPIQYFMIKLFNVKKINILLIIDFIIVISIELLQHITKTGIFDIDDVILNILGMIIIYFVTRKFEK